MLGMHYWYLIDDWFWEIKARLKSRFTLRDWQVPGVITAAATVGEIDRPDGKPRPPAGGIQ